MTQRIFQPTRRAAAAPTRRGAGRRPLALLLSILLAGATLGLGAGTASALTHGGKEYSGPGGVKYYVAEEVTVGEPIRISGTGWLHPEGNAGSVIGVKLDEGAVSTKRDVRHPHTGDLQPNKTIYAIAAADGNGEWAIELPWPTLENSSAQWAPGESHSLRLLTGSLLPDDTPRSVAASFATVDEEVETSTAPTITKQPSNASVAAGTDVTFTAEATGSPAPTVQWQDRTDDHGWAPIAGAQETALRLNGVTAAQTGTDYRAVFTNAAGTVASDPATLVVTAVDDDPVHIGTSDPTVRFTVPAEVEHGEDIRLSGTGWKVTDGSRGSIIAVKLDEGAVSTTREVVHPETGAPQANKTVHAVVSATADGSWSTTIPFPTLDNSDAEWRPGQTHSVRLLTGSFVTGDKGRTETASFGITGDDEGEPSAGPSDPPAWDHQTVTYTDPASGSTATAWISEDVEAGDGSTIKIKGTGWTNVAATGASTVALKLNYGAGRQYTRSGDGIVRHPSASADDTIWALLAPQNPESHPNVHTIASDGTFEVELDAPDGLTAGQYLSVLLQSGRFDTADVVRTVTSDFLVVGGQEYVDEGGPGEAITCRTDVSPSVTIENPDVQIGGLLHLTGSGWCHPDEDKGGSVIAIKIDEGAHSRLTTAVHQNKTIWATVAADDATGTIDAEIQLPDGTTAGPNGSDPAFTDGSHTLRLLTGSLKPGDAGRSLQSAEFIVGDYRPNGTPRPLVASEDLTDATKGGVVISQTAKQVTVTVPAAGDGDWVFLTAYDSDGSPRYPWLDTWFRTDAAGTVKASLSGVTLPSGRPKLTVQSGSSGEVGTLLGWGHLAVDAPTPPPVPKPSAPIAGGGSGGSPSGGAGPGAAPGGMGKSTTSSALKSPPAAAAPSTVPDAPFDDDSGLTNENTGDLSGTQDGTIVTITVPSAEPGDWVYLYAYSTPTPVGWIQVDENRQVKVDVALLRPGGHKIAVLDADGELIGWTSATVANTESPASDTVTDKAAAAAVAAPLSSVDGGLSATDWWLIAAGLLVLAGVTGGTAVAVRRRQPAPAGGDHR